MTRSPIAAVLAKDAEESISEEFTAAVVVKCFFCGNKNHPRKSGSARDIECYWWVWQKGMQSAVQTATHKVILLETIHALP